MFLMMERFKLLPNAKHTTYLYFNAENMLVDDKESLQVVDVTCLNEESRGDVSVKIRHVTPAENDVIVL